MTPVRLIFLALINLPLLLAACTEPGAYPVSGEECGPDDPVLELDAADCPAGSAI
ncbi:hypothetical protein K3553_10060 [Leisingera aquaemixtae]|uniref:hypothetical protein n=1 Tax=Leisingera aquaemixtae TaxID=1396826 RepID=UPI0021A519B3|nr:hypothetical protein [Leisingera aquaemixtae]UWQ23353.1 hypothetical protein K3553_10060 [Leisingera aquaemixtae]